MAEDKQNLAENTNASTFPSGKEAIDFEESYRAMNIGMQYVNETRKDFEQHGPQKWISDLVNLLSSCAKEIREFELEHTDDTVIWRDEDGVPHEVLVRLQDEKRFDEVMGDFVKAEKQFDEYFRKHALLVATRKT